MALHPVYGLISQARNGAGADVRLLASQVNGPKRKVTML